jgi:hypothetical protein
VIELARFADCRPDANGPVPRGFHRASGVSLIQNSRAGLAPESAERPVLE